MAWTFPLGTYLMACNVTEGPRGTFTVTVTENGTELHQEMFTGNDPADVHRRTWEHVWNLQERYRPRALAGFQREWDRQAREG